MADERVLRIAVEGCGHGTLDSIYASIEVSCRVKQWDGVDLLIIGGDFQAVRNASDLNCMAVPVKYREIGDFHKYYSGERVAPYLTIFIGGNHEAGNHLFELYYGGWVAPNIYYMGAANVLRLGPLRIAGLSGIWKGYNYRKPHLERLPYNQDDVRSIYHVRELDVRKLLQIRRQVDIGMSHDWPQGIEWLGDYSMLFRKKDLFEADARAGKLGSIAARNVLERLKPPHWFSAHLHIKYTALVDHSKGPLPNRNPPSEAIGGRRPSVPADSGVPSVMVLRNEEEIDLDVDVEVDTDQESKPEPSTSKRQKPNEDEIELEDEDEIDTNHASHPPITLAQTQNADEIDLGDDPVQANTSGSVPQANLDEIDLGGSDVDNARAPTAEIPSTSETAFAPHPVSTINPDLLAQLPASFSRPQRQSAQVLPEPLNTITNTTTRFLALDKCLPRRDFLQLLEINAVDVTSTTSITRPLRLSYDPEWLAITRAFAKDLKIGDPSAHIAPDRGRGHYLPLIEQEEKWVAQNITGDKLLVPENFTLTAPVQQPEQPTSTRELPREYSNPQTEAFCALLQIPNPFAASEAELLARHASAPREEAQRGGFGGGRGGHDRFGGGGGGRGGRGRGRERGRGRGRGR